MAKKKQKKLIMKNGDEFLVIGENSRFWLCEGTQFRKTSAQIQEVRSILPEPVEEAPADAEQESVTEETE